ncbi:putative Phage_integrase [Klebsormidium nitens]|uniref:Putative Phage_integrase n=1 Tax=Klebsormidium nitens TaxID=105231 RepID=A0A1Y1ISV7_KLENI|nr:putative Phage_integrase [Klebsormidium nitens]|eukprot:GAQ91268.1 putative Phage_integrase [Klebsormidium nitens]
MAQGAMDSALTECGRLAEDRLGFQRRCAEQLRAIRGVGLGGTCGASGKMSAEQTQRFYDGALASFGKIAEKSVNEARRNNPAKAEVVKSFRVGYEKMLHEQGVKVQRAKVFTEAKLDALLAHLAQLIQDSSPGLERCVMLTDQAAVLYLWETLARGKECGQLQRRQVELEEQAAYPGWSKTVRQEPSARIPLAAPDSQSRLTFVEAAEALLLGMEDGGHSVGGDGFLFRAMNRSRTGFVNEPMSSDTLRKRLQKRLKEAGLFEGETVHSFRRSAVQHAAVNLNYNVKQLMELGRWKSYAAFRLYVEEVWRKRVRQYGSEGVDCIAARHIAGGYKAVRYVPRVGSEKVHDWLAEEREGGP